MTHQTRSTAERLSRAANPFTLQDWAKKDGYYVATCRVSKDDVPNLIDIASKWTDPDWVGDELGLDLEAEGIDLLPITAWRALAELKSGESVEPLVDLLCELDDEYDDWTRTELPHVFGKIGSPAMGPLVRLANDSDKQESPNS